MWQSPPDEGEYATWKPLEKSEHHALSELAHDVGGALHPSVEQYFNAWWFCALEGQLGPHGISLRPVMPGLEPEDFLQTTRAYAQAHGGRLDHAPVGIEFDGLLVVLDNRSGEVALEDTERGTFQLVAVDLASLIRNLTP